MKYKQTDPEELEEPEDMNAELCGTGVIAALVLLALIIFSVVGFLVQ